MTNIRPASQAKFVLAICSTALLSACASTTVAVTENSCSPRSAWQRSLESLPLDNTCTADDYQQAARLARELNGLQAQRAQLQTSLSAENANEDGSGRIKRRIRQLDVDIEAIQGLARVRGLVDAGTTELPVNGRDNPTTQPE